MPLRSMIRSRAGVEGAGRIPDFTPAAVVAARTAYLNVRLLDKLFDFDEIRVHSRRKESQDAFAAESQR
ncbi:MAG: hypothetical protein KA755_07085, partial [Candidatus Microthrix sp.]|nr:hypothetical protein [Candidatus Microthrix sp.]